MWEGLGRTQRQDEVLHGTAVAANVVWGLIFLPAWIIGHALGGWVRALLGRRASRPPEALPVPPPEERSIEALMVDLRALPRDLRERRLEDLRFGLRDISNFVIAQHREGAVLGYRYPAQFKDEIFEGADGERIAAAIALHETPRPALIVVHGLFTSSRFDYVRRIAVRAYFEWGFNVAAIDLRSFGLTELTSPAPSTGGWKEGLDIVALGRLMKERSTSVGALGISHGAGSVLNASDAEGVEEALDGGILAISPPAIPKRTWARLAEPVPRRHPRYPLQAAFQAALTSRVRSGRWPPGSDDMERVMETLAAPYYAVSAEEIWSRAAGRDHVVGARVPLLVLHPEDDPIVKVEEAHDLAEAAAENDLVRVWILPAGSHGLIEAADPKWAPAVYRAFFERWATYAERGEASRVNGGGGKLVYSPSD